MKLLNSKVMSFEEDCVEYENEQEYLEDLDKRRKAGWTQLKTPDFENGVMKRVSKQLPNGHFTQRYKRFNGIKLDIQEEYYNMKFTYTGKALETKLMIEEGRKVYTINKLYQHSRGFYWKVNRMGYIHIIMPVRMSLNGEINHYEIEDRLLTNDNTLRVTKSYGNYDTILDCIKDIEKDLQVGGRMETVMLNDGSIEIVGSHRDLVDIVRDRCGDDIAKMVENLDPAVYDSLYRADCTVFEMANILENTDENGLLSEDQIDSLKDKVETLASDICDCI